MTATVIRNGDEITVQVTMKLTGSMLDMETALQSALNAGGILATQEALSKFDATGLPIKVAGITLTSKGKVAKEYQTPYGTFVLERHVYQSCNGGSTFCPLDDRARIITSSTPKLAQMISEKYAHLTAQEVADDLTWNHGRRTTHRFVQDTADIVGSIAQITEEAWDYEIPNQVEPIASISISLDGTCMLMRQINKNDAASRAANKAQLIRDFEIKANKKTTDIEIFNKIKEALELDGVKPDIIPKKVARKILSGEIDNLEVILNNIHTIEPGGYREAMTGNVTLYNPDGDRVHTIYLGATPEYGKAKFLFRLQNEVDKIKNKYPDATYVGLADGAANNWEFLTPNTQYQILDFYHAKEYLVGASYAFFAEEAKRKEWVSSVCHELKHINGAAKAILTQMEEQNKQIKDKKKVADSVKKKLTTAITYFTNQLSRMNYSEYTSKNLPIGSGVTEAACKTLIKQRLCRSGMRWKDQGARVVLALRALVQTPGRWLQFWDRINQNGISDLGIA